MSQFINVHGQPCECSLKFISQESIRLPMANCSELTVTICATWNTVSPYKGSFRKSKDFSLLGAKYYLRLHYGDLPTYSGYFYWIEMIRESEAQMSKSTVHTTTFIEDCAYDGGMYPVVQCGSVVLVKSAKITTIWSRRESDMPDEYKRTRSPWRVTCVFHGVASPTFQASNQTGSAIQTTVKLSDKSVQASLEIPFDFESLSLDFSNLLENEAIPDMKLRSGESIFSTHKAVLAARSEVFAAMFRNKMLESETATVDIKDIDAPVLRVLLKYMYSGKIEELPDDMVPSLYEAGDKYAVLALKRTCSERMLGNLTEEKCLDILILFDAHNDESSKDVVTDFILENEGVFQREAWDNFRKEQPLLALEVYQNYMEKKIFSKNHENS